MTCPRGSATVDRSGNHTICRYIVKWLALKLPSFRPDAPVINSKDFDQFGHHTDLVFADFPEDDWREFRILRNKLNFRVPPASKAIAFFLTLIPFDGVAASRFRIVNVAVLDKNNPPLTASYDGTLKETPSS